MSAAQHPSVVGTLTGGIQDVSAILPIIGTDQCENHVGSALEGGYLYAAASPLSMFGCLGIVKAAVAVLVSSTSVPGIATFRNMRYSSLQSRWLGARILANAGFKVQGSVAPLIGIDNLNKKRFKAEERLLEILEEKHIDDPESISIDWNSRKWNIMLAIFTLIAAGMSLAPYIALLKGPTSWRPMRSSPWLFPLLRTFGSCFAAICCQLLIQSRVIYLMKSRVLFMTIHRRLNENVLKDKKAELNSWLQQELDWNAELPSEQCIWRLDQFLSAGRSLTWWKDNADQELDLTPVETETLTTTSSVYSIPSWIWSPAGPPTFPNHLFRKHFAFDYNTLQRFRRTHFPDPSRDRNLALIIWVALLLSIPATIAGYVGCFTLVSASPGNGPLIWLGLESMLSIFRILIWAWNPKFDENTGVSIELKLTQHQPMVTTEDYNPQIYSVDHKERKPIVLIPERRFLERITPYTGPLEQSWFRNSENLAIYFTLTADYINSYGREFWSLLMTVLDVNKQTAVTLSQKEGTYAFFAATARYNPISGEMEATLDTVMHDHDPYRTKDPTHFDAMLKHYKYVLSALNQNNIRGLTEIGFKWDLFPLTPLVYSNEQDVGQTQPTLTKHNLLYLDQGYEHHLKSQMVDSWGQWIETSMESMSSAATMSCYEVLADKMSENAQLELDSLDKLIGYEWIRRKLLRLELSVKLEDILRGRMERCIDEIGKERGGVMLGRWMWQEFEIGRLKRMAKEQEDSKERMRKAKTYARDRAGREGQSFRDHEWQTRLEFIEDQRSVGTTGGHAALENAQSDLNKLIQADLQAQWGGDEFQQRFTHWHLQREGEQRMMETAVAKIDGNRWEPNVDGDCREKMRRVYKYPDPDRQATRRFVSLRSSTSYGMACAAIVYDVQWCDDLAIVCDVLQKSNTHSVINVHPSIIASIPPNDHLLFLSCEGGGSEPTFVQQNRDRWWEHAKQRNVKSSTCYFSPDAVSDLEDVACYSRPGTIVHIFIFLDVPSRVRLRLMHTLRLGASVSIQEDGKELAIISGTDPHEELHLQAIELAEIRSGGHELEVVVNCGEEDVSYFLRDILVDFPENTGLHFPGASVGHVDVPIQTITDERIVDMESTSSQTEDLLGVIPDIQNGQ